MLALAAVGLTLVYGTTGISNFAHAEMVTFGPVVAGFPRFFRHTLALAAVHRPAESPWC